MCYGEIPKNFKTYYETKVVPYATRSKGSLDVIPCTTGYGSKAVKVNGALPRNNTHRDIRELGNMSELKEGLMEYYISLYVWWINESLLISFVKCQDMIMWKICHVLILKYSVMWKHWEVPIEKMCEQIRLIIFLVASSMRLCLYLAMNGILQILNNFMNIWICKFLRTVGLFCAANISSVAKKRPTVLRNLMWYNWKLHRPSQTSCTGNTKLRQPLNTIRHIHLIGKWRIRFIAAKRSINVQSLWFISENWITL